MLGAASDGTVQYVCLRLMYCMIFVHVNILIYSVYVQYTCLYSVCCCECQQFDDGFNNSVIEVKVTTTVVCCVFPRWSESSPKVDTVCKLIQMCYTVQMTKCVVYSMLPI